ncbi:MAG: hypothetical protein CVV21_04645 [Candidatus Goldiibacteriota bacterium HGW-Goldbacteria-1]|jgi:zinc transport system substrate-binding protein|nr:MAG: hypothetical protein CVV21_04645 [Candidatus Goldiibacteriota bacterium HGW-Goldbacteria-1]
MKKIFVLLAAVIIFSSCGDKTAQQNVLCGTSMIASLAKDIAPGIKNTVLIPPDACPGHFDLKPQDALAVKKAKLIIIHPYQQALAQAIKKINKKARVEVLKASALTTPEGYFNGLSEMAALLNGNFPGNFEQYEKNRQAVVFSIMENVTDDQMYISCMRKKKVKAVVSAVQKDLAEYFGFVPVTLFGEAENLTANEIASIIKEGRNKSAAVILSNLNGSHDTSAEIINKELKVKKAVLLNFPGAYGDDSAFLALWRYNFNLIKQTAGDCRQ